MSLTDACHLSRTRVEIAPHRDVTVVEQLPAKRTEERTSVLTDSVFSAYGDHCHSRGRTSGLPLAKRRIRRAPQRHSLLTFPRVNTCAECGFCYDLASAAEVPSLAREHAVEYADLLGADTGKLRQRGRPDVWSPLEYACHMRDVLLAQRERVLAARRLDNPPAIPMGRDERVEYDGYAEQAPADVARQIRDAALLFANVLERLGDEDWERTLSFPYPEQADRSLRWLALHTLHEMRHHLLDMHRQLDG